MYSDGNIACIQIGRPLATELAEQGEVHGIVNVVYCLMQNVLCTEIQFFFELKKGTSEDFEGLTLFEGRQSKQRIQILWKIIYPIY